MGQTAVVSWVKNVFQAKSCNFPTYTKNFRLNSDRQLQIPNTGDYGCSKSQFSCKFSQDSAFLSANMSFSNKFFWKTKIFFNNPNFR